MVGYSQFQSKDLEDERQLCLSSVQTPCFCREEMCTQEARQSQGTDSNTVECDLVASLPGPLTLTTSTLVFLIVSWGLA